VNQDDVFDKIGSVVKDALNPDPGGMTIKVYRLWPISKRHPAGQWYKTYPYGKLPDIESLVSEDYGRGKYRYEVWSDGRKCNDQTVVVGGGPALDTMNEEIPVDKREPMPDDDASQSAFGAQGDVMNTGRGMALGGNGFRGDPFHGMGTTMAASFEQMKRKEQEWHRKEYEYEQTKIRMEQQIREMENSVREKDRKLYDLEIEKRGHEDIEERNRKLKEDLRKSQGETDQERQKIYGIELENNRLKAMVESKNIELKKIDEMKLEMQRMKDQKETADRQVYQLQIERNALQTKLESEKAETVRQVELAKVQAKSGQGGDAMTMMLLNSILEKKGGNGMDDMRNMFSMFREMKQTTEEFAPPAIESGGGGGTDIAGILNGVGSVLGAARGFIMPPQAPPGSPQAAPPPQAPPPHRQPPAIAPSEPVARFDGPTDPQVPNEPVATQEFAAILDQGLSELPSPEEWATQAIPYVTGSGARSLMEVKDEVGLNEWAKAIDGMSMDKLYSVLVSDPKKAEWIQHAFGALQGVISRG